MCYVCQGTKPAHITYRLSKQRLVHVFIKMLLSVHLDPRIWDHMISALYLSMPLLCLFSCRIAQSADVMSLRNLWPTSCFDLFQNQVHEVLGETHFSNFFKNDRGLTDCLTFCSTRRTRRRNDDTVGLCWWCDCAVSGMSWWSAGTRRRALAGIADIRRRTPAGLRCQPVSLRRGRFLSSGPRVNDFGPWWLCALKIDIVTTLKGKNRKVTYSL